MREHYGWQFPDLETHLPRMLKKSVDKGLPAEYQIAVRQRSIELCKKRDVALDIGANVGLWSRDLVKSFNRVIAFEPVSLFRECLESNVKGENFEVLEPLTIAPIKAGLSSLIFEIRLEYLLLFSTAVIEGLTFVLFCEKDRAKSKNSG